MTDPNPDDSGVQPLEVPDTITRYAAYNTTLGQFFGPVYVGEEPSDAAVRRQLEELGNKGHKWEVRQV